MQLPESQVQWLSLPLRKKKKSMLSWWPIYPWPDHHRDPRCLYRSDRQRPFDLGRKITETTGEAEEASFLFQRCSVLVQCFNAILLHDSSPAYYLTDWMIVLKKILYFLQFLNSLRIIFVSHHPTLQCGSLSRDIRFARRFGPLAIPDSFLDFFVFNPSDLYY